MCVFICVCVVIALELLLPHVNYISSRGLLLCWARAQDNTDTHKQIHKHTKTHNEQKRQAALICDGLRFPQPTKQIMQRQTCTELVPFDTLMMMCIFSLYPISLHSQQTGKKQLILPLKTTNSDILQHLIIGLVWLGPALAILFYTDRLCQLRSVHVLLVTHKT